MVSERGAAGGGHRQLMPAAGGGWGPRGMVGRAMSCQGRALVPKGCTRVGTGGQKLSWRSLAMIVHGVTMSYWIVSSSL